MVMVLAFTLAVLFLWAWLSSLCLTNKYIFWLKLVSIKVFIFLKKVFVLLRVNIGFNIRQEHDMVFKGLKIKVKHKFFPYLLTI